MKFFVWIDEKQQGPFDEETIQKMVSEGQITHETLLCPEAGNLDWTPAKELFPSETSTEAFIVSPRNTLAEEIRVTGNNSAFDSQPFDFSGFQSDDGSRLHIRLTSGLELRIKAVRLYDEFVLANINLKRAEALQKLQGVSTGLGSLGSIGWVLASSVVIGAVEGVLSAGSSASGINLLAEVIQIEQKFRSEGLFIAIGKTENIETPIPGVWRVSYSQKQRVKTGVNFWSEEQFEMRDIPNALIHSGDEFVSFQTEDDSIHLIRWTSVEEYNLLKA